MPTLRGHTALKSILWQTLFLDQLHDFSLLSFDSFLHSFLKLEFMKKKFVDIKKKIHFWRPIFINQHIFNFSKFHSSWSYLAKWLGLRLVRYPREFDPSLRQSLTFAERVTQTWLNFFESNQKLYATYKNLKLCEENYFSRTTAIPTS